MRDVFSRLQGRLRHGLATQEILDGLARRGLVFYPYIVFEESPDARFDRAPALEKLNARRLTEDDAEQLAAISVRSHDAEAIRKRFRRGDVGVGAFDGSTLVAYTWCDLERFGSIGQKGSRRALAHDEAYLYDAFTLPAYRGHGLVPYLRSEVYKLMDAAGRRRLYSVSLFFNRSARRFKAKLGASAVELRLSINLFQRFKRDLRLRRYPSEPPARPA